MHYLAFVLIPDDGDPHEHVSRLMAPHQERYEKETDTLGGFWDFWSIGGRWSGYLDGYQPEKDPKNIERCDLCAGTGQRLPPPLSGAGTWTCNGCEGTGSRVKWPTQWAPHHGDIAPAAVAHAKAAADSWMPYTVVVGSGEALHARHWNGERFEENAEYKDSVLRALSEHTGRVAVVDYHR